MTAERAHLVANGVLITAGAALAIFVLRQPRARRIVRRTMFRMVPCLLAGCSTRQLAAAAVAAALDAAQRPASRSS